MRWRKIKILLQKFDEFLKESISSPAPLGLVVLIYNRIRGEDNAYFCCRENLEKMFNKFGLKYTFDARNT